MDSSTVNSTDFVSPPQPPGSPPPPPPPLPTTPSSTQSVHISTTNQSPIAHSDSWEATPSADYLGQLVKDKRQIMSLPSVFLHAERLLDREICAVRENLHKAQINVRATLPEAEGQIVTISEKIYIPVEQHPEFNFIGRILGPRGMTAKQLESETGCKIMVRGKGSIRDRAKEEQMKDKPNWQHLSDNLHVLVSCEDYENRAHVKLKAAIQKVNALLEPKPEGEDELKKRQLIELAILNGTYRDNPFASQLASSFNRVRLMPNFLTTGIPQMAVPHLVNSVTGPTPVFVTSTDQAAFLKARNSFHAGSQYQLANNQALVAAATGLSAEQQNSLFASGQAGMFDNSVAQAATMLNPGMFYIQSQPEQYSGTATGAALNGAAAAFPNLTNPSQNLSRMDCQSMLTVDSKNNVCFDVEPSSASGPIRHSQKVLGKAQVLIQPRVQFQGMPVQYHFVRQSPYSRTANQC